MRQLLLNQFDAITARINKPNTSRHRTKVYIRFSYKKDITYLGFYLPCTHDLPSHLCNLPVSYCMSKIPQRCPLHYSDINKIHVPIKQLSRKEKKIPFPEHGGPRRSNDVPEYDRVIPITNHHINISYDKQFIESDSYHKVFDRNTFVLPNMAPTTDDFGLMFSNFQQLPNSSVQQQKRFDRFCKRVLSHHRQFKSSHRKASKQDPHRLPKWPVIPSTMVRLGPNLTGTVKFVRLKFYQTRVPNYHRSVHTPDAPVILSTAEKKRLKNQRYKAKKCAHQAEWDALYANVPEYYFSEYYPNSHFRPS